MKATTRSDHEWVPLNNREDAVLYDMSMCSEANGRTRLLPGALFVSKMRFITMEAFGDITGYRIGSFGFYAMCFVMLFAFWFSRYIHYLGQYLFLSLIGSPIFAFNPQVLQISFKYMSTGITAADEIGLVCMGPMSVLILFGLFILLGLGLKKFAGKFKFRGGS